MGHTHQAPFAQTNEALINEVLGEYGDLTRQRLQAFLPQEEPKLLPVRVAGRLPAAWRKNAALQPVHRHGARDRCAG